MGRWHFQAYSHGFWVFEIHATSVCDKVCPQDFGPWRVREHNPLRDMQLVIDLLHATVI